MKQRPFTLQIQPEIATALSRRHNGREDITQEEARDAYLKMRVLRHEYQKAVKRLKWIDDVFWEQERIEQRFGSPAFYGAHLRRRNALKKLDDTHRDMFHLLVCTDGNYEPYSPNHSICAEGIYLDFISKYKKYL